MTVLVTGAAGFIGYHVSAALLARLGFVREGLARDYLYIGNAWRDHVLNALTNPRFDASSFARS